MLAATIGPAATSIAEVFHQRLDLLKERTLKNPTSNGPPVHSAAEHAMLAAYYVEMAVATSARGDVELADNLMGLAATHDNFYEQAFDRWREPRRLLKGRARFKDKLSLPKYLLERWLEGKDERPPWETGYR